MTATANIANTKVVPSETKLKPFYDNFSEDSNHHRILFRPGYAVQARELTQIQTILQNQIERFGMHVFKNGSLVLGGSVTLDLKVNHLNLAPEYAATAVDVTDFIGNMITLGSGNTQVRAFVTSGAAATETDPPTLMIKYVSGYEFTDGSTIKTLNSNVYANVASANSYGTGATASIQDSIFFINGYFVKVPKQTVVASKYNQSANCKIGLEYDEVIVTETSDPTLLDPAQESSNYQAPGAARLQINFDLATRSLESEDDQSFVELMRVDRGVVKKITPYAEYSDLGDTLARRTYDESGNYTVKAFRLNIVDSPGDATRVGFRLDPGKAYLSGYEFETVSQTFLDTSRARETANVYNQDVTINFGNYLYIQNTKGYFDTTSMERIDLHSVPYSYVNLASSTGYTSTKVGTARVRELKYYSASNTGDSNTIIQTLSIFDTKFSNLTSNANVVTSNTMTIFDVSGKFSANNSAYTGATLRITSGLGSGESHTISDYVASTKTVTISDTFLTTPNAASQISINFSLAQAESILKHTTHTSSATNANTNINVLSKSDGTSNGDTVLSDTTFNSLIFPFSENFVKAGSIVAQDYQFMGIATATFTSGSATITLPSGQSFAGTTDSTGRSAVTMTSFQSFRSDTGSRMTLTSVTVDNSGTPTATITDNSTYSGTAYVYYIVNLNTGDLTLQKSKTLVTGNTTHFVGSTSNGSFMTGTTNATVYLVPGQVTITAPSSIPNDPMSIYVSDVKNVTAIYDLAGAAIPAAGTSIESYSDVTSKFLIDGGQKDTHYDHASIALKPRNGTVAGPLIVCYDRYSHSVGPGSQDGKGYFSVDSYPNATTTGYIDIPSYTTSAGITYQLRDVIDFRPTRASASNATPSYSMSGIRLPVSGTSFESNYEYYLGKKAHIILTRDSGQPFKIVEGVSSRNPTEPKIVENSMLLYKLTLEPYTMTTQNVRVQYVENKRYTMRDIGTLEKRIENLEYYQALTLLEQSATNMSILDENGLERTKYGILADDFTTHGYGNVNDPDYLVAIDRVLGGLYPAQNTVSMQLYESANSTSTTLGDKTTIRFNETYYIQQNLATKYVSVQPFMLAQWLGKVQMDPPADNWISESTNPDIVINMGVNDALAAANSASGGTRADSIKANNKMVTEAYWWNTFFGRPVESR